jgi:twitching motility protein PilT
MVNYLNNNRSGIVVTIEDPVEYIHTNNKCIIKQREIGRDTLSFSAAAKNALRQNPDILVIGEILDVETMDVAITAAETGSLVLATIHAGNCVQALDRAIGFFAPDVQKNILSRLSMVVKGVITQMLIPKLDESGLVVAAEVLVANDAIRKLIRTADWKSIPSFIQTGKNLGMQLMRDSLEVFCQQGIIDPAYLLEESKT